MPRCPNGTKKNVKTGNCEPKSTVSPNKKSPTGTQKKQPAKKIYLDENIIEAIIRQHDAAITRNKDTIETVRTHLQKTYYKPRFTSEYYPKGAHLKEIKQNIIKNAPQIIKDAIKDDARYKNLYISLKLLESQVTALFIGYAVGDYKISDFSLSRSSY